MRSLSQLNIIDDFMQRIKYDLKLIEDPRPCEYFHMIGGTGMGGYVSSVYYIFSPES